MPHKMSESEYLDVLNSFEADAKQHNTNFNNENEELLRRYKGELYGDELPERSSVVSNDVQDVVESDMPSLARNFLGARKPCIFEPRTLDPEEINEAREKTEYVDFIVRGQDESFRTQHNFLKDIEIQKLGALKYFVEDIVEKRTVTHEDISFEELAALEESLKDENSTEVKITNRSEIDETPNGERLDVTFEVTRNKRQVKVIGIPLESLLISRNATSEEDATLVGDTVRKSRGELLQEGFSMEQIKDLPTSGLRQGENATLSHIRFNDEGGVAPESFKAWANEKVDISDFLVKIDKDGDGFAERRHIVKSGDVILEDEAFEIVNYAITSAILMPHTIIGTSRAELAAPVARIKTTLLRGILDNSYAHNAPQIGINDNVEMDDLLVKRPNGIVRVDGTENPGQSIFTMNIEYIGDKALQVIQHMDSIRAQTTGTLLASQGLNSDTFEKETAARFNGVQDDSQAKIELVVRVIAETAYCRMYSGIAWLISQYQTTEVEMMVLGKPLTVNPANWKHRHQVKSTLGLGSGDGERTTETLSTVYTIQQQLKAQGSPLVDEVKIYNTLDSILKSLDIHNTTEFFNNPERPEQLITAENEKLKVLLQQLQQTVEQLQNPLAEAERISAEAKLIEAKGKAGLKAAEITEDVRQFDVTTAEKSKQSDRDLAVDLTKIVVDSGKDIEGSLV